ncbi:MAG: hypothetical protein HYU51_14850 [Candidatus Rokubacteria bacterium]|nr:hypothetical protein [Candidatus Rokubacteria bacterium]
MQYPVFSRCESPVIRPRAVPVVLLLLALLVFGVAGWGNRTGVPTTLHADAVSGARDRAIVSAHEGATRDVIASIIRDLGLPVPSEFSVFVYPSRDRFREGLVRDAHIAPARAAELAEFAIGVGKRRVLLFNDDGTAGHGREWVRLVAHELTHLAQFELAEGEGRGEQWLAEGLAEWTAFTVLERLGLDTVARRRRLASVGIRDGFSGEPLRLGLEGLGTPRGFTTRHQRDGALPIYQLAFLLADNLIRRNGIERVAGYFRSFQGRADRYENFELAFGQSLAAFEAEFEARLRNAAR